MRIIKLTYFLVSALLGLALGMVSNLNGQTRDGEFSKTVQKEFSAAFQGDQAAMERGMKLCEEMLAKGPKHPEALVWHGAGLFYQAGQAFQSGDLENAGALMTRGRDEMDEAAALAPANVCVRLTRGLACSKAARAGAPDPHTLYQKSNSDFEKVVEATGDGFTQMPASLRSEVLLGLGYGYQEHGDIEKAKAFMYRVTRETPGTPAAETAAKWLEGRGD